MSGIDIAVPFKSDESSLDSVTVPDLFKAAVTYDRSTGAGPGDDKGSSHGSSTTACVIGIGEYPSAGLVDSTESCEKCLFNFY